MAYEIEKGISAPRRTPPSRKGFSKYPWASMVVGDSFFVAGVRRSSLYKTARSHLGEGGARILPEGDGFRVWRKA